MIFSNWVMQLGAAALFLALPKSVASTSDLSVPPWAGSPVAPKNTGKTCTVIPLGGKQDDVPQILAAFNECNHGGRVVFPEGHTYWIAQKLNPVVTDVTVDWKGTWLFSDDVEKWRNNTYWIEFQNHWTAFALSGKRIHINGHGTGGINGSGNSWYNVEKAFTQPGRPMAFTPWNVTDLHVEHCGDDAIAIKPRSYGIYMQNVTIHGGNGPAIGSLGQYLEDNSVKDIIMRDVHILSYNEDMKNAAYVKTWVGELVPQDPSKNGWYESGGKPRGGGWGNVTNIRFENFHVEGASAGASINQNSGDNGSYAGTSKMLVSDVTFVNFTGYISNSKSGSVSCSKRYPCYNIAFEDFSLAQGSNGTATNATGSCSYIKPGGVIGLNGCDIEQFNGR
ncbi:Glycosyl hydrolases family 28 [Aspergillus parasiticus SU-1]|uniref:galacturonan 1,4-alpha-galacturonidase n=1 Tax=Aspergillus parasiticus (strain ATCC 56775 / NRRL 5862 / SRRC 143 / SU-1) TaxID=1403190 RepID=A0A0F0IA37_ASPPU|nr:Glycosyl hydrolases family 28 [Aspergillus parasiticus SU-1]